MRTLMGNEAVLVASGSVFEELPDRFVTAPGFGSFCPAQPRTVTSEGELVRAGDVLGELDASDGRIPVHAPCDAWVMDVLVRAGERVRPGRPLVHLRAL